MKLLPFLLFITMPLMLLGQDFTGEGFPLITNYTPSEIDAHIQSWEFAVDSSGVIYIANNNSIIRFDGVNWQDIEFPLYSVYEITSDIEGNIYVGGNNEIGYLDFPENDTLSLPQYYSLRQLIPDSLNFSRITAIESIGSDIYFCSPFYLLKYDGSKFQIFRAENRFYDLFVRDGQAYISDGTVGIKTIQDNQLKFAEWADSLKGTVLFGYVKLPQKEIFCSWEKCFQLENGNFSEFQTEADDFFSNNYIDEVIGLQDGTLLFGTRQGGVANIDSNGNLIHILNEETGLISNTIYGLLEMSNGMVWVATTNGISKVEYGLPLRRFDNRSGIDQMPMSLLHHKERLYLTVNSGLFYKERNSQSFKKMIFGDSCYKSEIMNNILYTRCSTTYKISNGAVTQFRDELTQFFPYKDNYVLYYTSTEVGIGKIDQNDFSIVEEISFDSGEINDLVSENPESMWVFTESNGVFKIDISRTKEEFELGEPVQILVNVEDAENETVQRAEIKGSLLFLTDGKGVLKYNYEADSLEKVDEYGDYLQDYNRQYFRLAEDKEGNIWMRSAQAYQGLLKKENGEYELYEGVLNRIDDRQSNDIYPDPYGYVWYATDKGLVRYTKNNDFNYNRSFYVGIDKVLVRNDSLINGGVNQNTDVLKYKDNELRFTFAAASYDDPTKTEYRVQLNSFDENWSMWSLETQKDYTNIPEGEYNFVVQAKNVYGVVSESGPFYFSVLPPWYRTWWAYILYVLIVGAILYLAYKIRVNQLLKVHRMRDRIASDLHDEVSATLSSISFFAQAIEDDRGRDDKGRFVKLIYESAGDAKEKITDIVWAINPANDDWKSFLSKCRRYASDLLESKDIMYSLKIDEDIPGNLDMELRQNLWMVYKEMVTNAVRHSEAKQLDVILTYDDGKVSLIVQDDGKGMNEEFIRKGNGLVNIRKRAEEIHGIINLDSDTGFGTRWSLKVPL